MRFLHMATRLASTHQSGLVCGARRPADAGDQHPGRPGPQHHRAETLHDEGVPSSRWQPTGISWRTDTSVQPGAVSAPGQASGSVWRGSRRRHRPDTRLAAQSPNPHVWRLSMSWDILPAKEAGLLPLPRLRTGRESFPSSGSSLSKAV